MVDIASVSANVITYDLDSVEQRSRLTTFFRGLLAIPIEIFLLLYLIAVYVAVFIAWFALLFTARYPRGLYDFVGRRHTAQRPRPRVRVSGL